MYIFIQDYYFIFIVHFVIYVSFNIYFDYIRLSGRENLMVLTSSLKYWHSSIYIYDKLNNKESKIIFNNINIQSSSKQLVTSIQIFLFDKKMKETCYLRCWQLMRYDCQIIITKYKFNNCVSVRILHLSDARYQSILTFIWRVCVFVTQTKASIN